MVRAFYVLVALLLSSVLAVASHYLFFDREHVESRLLAVANLSKIVSPSLAVTYYEPRVLAVESASNPAYPEMQTINKQDFIYAH